MFTETGRISADDAALIDPAVVRSWRRCIVRANCAPIRWPTFARNRSTPWP